MTDKEYNWGGSVTKKPLFGTWLRETLTLQRDYFNNDLHAFSGKERSAEILLQSYAAEDELHEATGEVSWKPWAKAEFFNREAYIGEIVDALHFVANMLCLAKCTDAELNAAYEEKMERNRQRQMDGYTGLDKCAECRRAVDDIVAHGGRMNIELVGPNNEQWCTDCTVGEFGAEEVS